MKHLILLLSSMLMFLACDNEPPEIHALYWAGDSAKMAITRSQAGEAVACSDVKFDDFVCTTYSEMQGIHETYLNACKLWEKDAKKVQDKLKSCGLMTKENINIIAECLSSK